MAMLHTEVCQRNIGYATSWEAEFNKIQQSGMKVRQPIVFVPSQTASFLGCCEPMYTIPAGPWVLQTSWGASGGPIAAGVKTCWPFWQRVSHIVTASAITYNAPARGIPTADNVLVDIDTAITFTIGPDAEDAERFVYRLGASRLDGYLDALTEEALRGLVFDTTHDHVHDLREEFAVGIKASLNGALHKYGIKISSVKVKGCKLPDALQARLEKTTGFKTLMEENEKQHENALTRANDSHKSHKLGIERENARRVQDITSDINRYEVEKGEMVSNAEGEARVRMTKTTTQATMEGQRASGASAESLSKAQRTAAKAIGEAKLKANQITASSAEQCRAIIVESETTLATAKAKAGTMLAEAEAEDKATSLLHEKRKFELEWARLEVYKKMAAKGRHFIDGALGKEVLGMCVPKTGSMERS